MDKTRVDPNITTPLQIITRALLGRPLTITGNEAMRRAVQLLDELEQAGFTLRRKNDDK